MGPSRVVLPVALAAALVLLPGGGAGAQDGTTYVRVAHLSPDTAGVDIYVDGSPTLGNVGFNTVSDYLPIPPGPHRLELRPAGALPTDPPVLSAEPVLEAGLAYTVAGVGAADSLQGQIFEDDLSPPPAGQAKVRAIHAAVDIPAVDVAVKGGPVLFSGTGFTTATPYASVEPGTYDLELRAEGTKDVLVTASGVELSPGLVYSLTAIGGGAEPVSFVPVVDARGTAATPLGAVAAGGGGAADGGSGLHPGIVVAVVGGAAVAASAAVRRRRSPAQAA